MENRSSWLSLSSKANACGLVLRVSFLLFGIFTTPGWSAEVEATSSAADEAHRTYLETLRKENRYPTAVSCAQCHPDHFEEWSVSPHAYAMLSPVFNSMHTFITRRTEGTNGDFCIRCHTPVGMEREEDIYGSALLRSPAVREGVTCITCHRVSKDYGTSSGRISLEPGPLSHSIYGPAGDANLRAALGDSSLGLVTDEKERGKLIHKEAIQSPVISKSGQCSMCHDVNSPTGIRLESASTEFKHSPAAREGTSCQDCHMGVKAGTVLPDQERYTESGRDLNYAFEPAARIRNSPRDHSEGIETPPRKRTNHMFIGPDYSIVHPGIFPHSLATSEFTFGTRFRETFKEESKELVAYLKTLPTEPDPEAKEEAEKQNLRVASRTAEKHALSDWLSFRWEEGWGTEAFEELLSETERNRRLAGVAFPWADPDDPDGASKRRKTARLLLAKQFHLLNRAHVERTRILRRALQLGNFEVSRDDNRMLAFQLDVHNAMKGHAVPTGFDAERVMYLEVTVRDAHGNLLFQSGDRDPNGDLRDLHSSYVHASAPKEAHWLEQSSWKEALGLKRSKSELEWRPDPYLFSLQSKFITQNLAGGEREQVLPLNTSLDPLPFVRPPTTANVHTGRGGGARKQFRTIPPLSHRTAKYKLDRNQLSGARPYKLHLALRSQMVPVNLVKKISTVGFDMNLSPREVAQRVAYGHKVDTRGTRRGGTVTIWEHRLSLKEHSGGFRFNFTPSEERIMEVPIASFPFPHASKEELEANAIALRGVRDLKDYMIQHLGPHLPELWPGGVPEGLPLLPSSDSASLFPSDNEESATNSESEAPPIPPISESDETPPENTPAGNESRKIPPPDFGISETPSIP